MLRKTYHRLLRIYQAVQILNKFGHKVSNKKKLSIDKEGNPIPWYTYPAIHYLNQLDLTDKNIFEWGSGYSSIYFSDRAKKVYSVDHNKDWYEQILKTKKNNHSLSLATDKDYISHITTYNCKFDVIIIDGVLRKECTSIATDYLKEGGIIIFDNCDRHPSESKLLREKGLIQTDFHGFGPGVRHTWTTSIFYDRNFNFKPLTHQPLHPLGSNEIK